MEEKTTIVMLFSMYTSTKLVVGPDILGEILFVVTVGFDGGLGRVPIPIIRGGQVDGCSQYCHSIDFSHEESDGRFYVRTGHLRFQNILVFTYVEVGDEQ